jgi:hypothetical protein
MITEACNKSNAWLLTTLIVHCVSPKAQHLSVCLFLLISKTQSDESDYSDA